MLFGLLSLKRELRDVKTRSVFRRFIAGCRPDAKLGDKSNLPRWL
jgi:hypothetical protein